jgi:hypothetical protein
MMVHWWVPRNLIQIELETPYPNTISELPSSVGKCIGRGESSSTNALDTIVTDEARRSSPRYKCQFVWVQKKIFDTN